MRKKIKNEIKKMVANLEWANEAPAAAPDNEAYYRMAYLLPVDVTSNNNEDLAIAKAVLLSRPDSHPFTKRTLLLNQPVKVGRAVGKIKAAPDNAIFDCKVLSRHHASLWYSNGRFYLQDTKSSNGTFVNNHRLSEGSEESLPYEVCSKDIVQFGVDVLENSNKIRHGCIVAALRLYHPDGKEALGSPKPSSNVEDLCVLNNILQEVFQREHLLEAKLHSLRQLVASCGAALSEAWRALCSEERLVARVQFLERRLVAVNAASAQQQPNELQQLLDDKHQYELNAREALQTAHEEKLKLLNQLGTIQWSMCSSEEECAILRGHVDRAHLDLQDLGEKKSAIENDLQESKKALVAAEKLIERMVAMLKEGKNENGYAHNEEVEAISNIGNNTEENPLPEALKDLPKHVKALLSEQLLERIMGDPKLPNHIKQLESKLYHLKQELFELESIKSIDMANDNTSSQSDDKNGSEIKSENKENSEYMNSTKSLDTEKTYIDTEGNGYIMPLNDNTENTESTLDSTFFVDKLGAEATKEMKSKLIRDNINELTEQLDTFYAEEGSTQLLVVLQKELSNAESRISNISKELDAANDNLAISKQKIHQLTLANDELYVENKDLKQNFSNKAEECRKLELLMCQTTPEEKEKSDEDEDEVVKYKYRVSELQNKLEEVLQEMERLHSVITGLEQDLQGRPLSSHMEQQSRLVKTLRDQLETKEKEIQDLTKQLSVLTEMQISMEEKLNKKCSNSVSTHVQTHNKDVATKHVMTESIEEGPIVISCSLAAADLLDNHTNLSSEELNNSSISVDLQRLTELEEELVITKEKCAQINQERTQMSLELKSVNDKYNHLLKRSRVDMLVYIIPCLAIFIYLFMYQYIS